MHALGNPDLLGQRPEMRRVAVAGGPSTLDLRPTAPGCYRAVAQDDQGAEKVPPGLVFHIGTAKTVPAPAGRICPKKPHGLVWATAPGSVRSNRLP